MNQQYKCTVVMPVGRVDEDARLQIESMLTQRDVGSYEVVVSLNTSDPGQARALQAIVESFADERLRVVPSHDRRGASHARNVGAGASDSPLLAFCDSDDLAEPGWLAGLLAALPSHDAAGGALVDDAARDNGQATWRPPATPGELPSFMGAPYLVSASMAITRVAFDAVGGFDEDLTRCEDIAISFALTAAGYQLGFAPDSRMHYRQRPGLRAMLRQHYWYGRGMSEVLVRYGVPAVDGLRRPRGLELLRANGQVSERRSAAGRARRLAIASGRLVGLVTERTHRRSASLDLVSTSR
jgi:GT2 family glycosyltransferase